MLTPKRCPTALLVLLVTALLFVSQGRAGDEPASAPEGGLSAEQRARRTPLVELIERVMPSVACIDTREKSAPGTAKFGSGTGVVLHESGYLITNHHVVVDAVANRVTLADGRASAFRIIAALPHEDLALVRINVQQPVTPVPLGRSHDLMLGEEVLTIGNSHGLGSTVSPGIVSGLDRVRISTASRTIQTTAAVNPGNSGGPLFNSLGEMIGIITRSKAEAENIGYAIPVDRLREVFPQMLSPEERFGLVLGIEVDTMTEPARVTHVAPQSPAAKVGVRVGDQIAGAGKLAVHSGLDFYMSLADYRPEMPFPLEIKREDKLVSVSPTLQAYDPPDPVPAEGLDPGLQFAVYRGHWNELPDFDRLEPVATGTCNKFSHAIYPENAAGVKQKEEYGLRLTGFVKVPDEGVYLFYTRSDDGSRLYIHDRLVVDNDRPHPVALMGGLVRLKAGLHPIKVTFFERTEAELLEVAWEGPGVPRQEIPPDALFFKPQEQDEPAEGEAADSPAGAA